MSSVGCVCAEFVSEMVAGREEIGNRLAWLARRCGALTAEFSVRRLQDQIPAQSIGANKAAETLRAGSAAFAHGGFRVAEPNTQSSSTRVGVRSIMLGETAGEIGRAHV